MKPTPLLDVRTHGDAVVVEAPTAEAALEEVSTRLGPDARIVDARKVHRGGIAGFFARELVRLTAAAGDEPATDAPRSGGTAPDTAPRIAAGGLDAVLADLREEADGREASFEAILRSRLAKPAEPDRDDPADGTGDAVPAPAPAAHAAAPVAPDPAHADPLPATAAPALVDGAAAQGRPASPGTGVVDWSTDELHRHGIPAVVLDACAGLDPQDDLGWLRAVAGAVSSFCRPLPAGSAVLAGPRASRLNEVLGLPAAVPDEAPPYGGTVCLSVNGDRQSRDWMAWCRGDRWLHLVVGGGRWKALLADEPLAISWVGADMLPDALAQCAQLGLVLGYGSDGGKGAPVVRADPLDVALGVRALLPRR